MKNFYENPELQSLNRLPMRSHLIPYESELKALTECAEGPESHEKSESSFIQYLDGQWDFAFSTNPELSFNDVKKWDKIILTSFLTNLQIGICQSNSFW